MHIAYCRICKKDSEVTHDEFGNKLTIYCTECLTPITTITEIRTPSTGEVLTRGNRKEPPHAEED